MRFSFSRYATLFSSYVRTDIQTDQISSEETFSAFCSMNSRRGSTWSPISQEKISLAPVSSLTSTRCKSGSTESIAVFYSCSGFISPKPLGGSFHSTHLYFSVPNFIFQYRTLFFSPQLYFPGSCAAWRLSSLLHRHRLGEVAGLVDVGPFQHRHVVREELERHHLEDRPRVPSAGGK